MWKVQLLFIFNQKTALNVVLKQHGENCKSLLQKPFDFSPSLSHSHSVSLSLSVGPEHWSEPPADFSSLCQTSATFKAEKLFGSHEKKYIIKKNLQIFFLTLHQSVTQGPRNLPERSVLSRFYTWTHVTWWISVSSRQHTDRSLWRWIFIPTFST